MSQHFALPRSKKIQLSKAMSYLLRHGAEKEKIPMDSKGFISIPDLMRHKSIRKFTFEDIQFVVDTCEKKRFYLEQRDDIYYIRANQGHSIQTVDVDMEIITDPTNVVAVHGTYYRFWDAIKMGGLSKMSRQHVHLSAGEPGSSGVISGMRSSAQIMIYIDVAKAMEDNIVFLRSANNVILTSGRGGVIPPKYFSKVIDVKTGESLL